MNIVNFCINAWDSKSASITLTVRNKLEDFDYSFYINPEQDIEYQVSDDGHFELFKISTMQK